MLKWLKQLDQILRGEATKPALLKDSQFDIPIAGLCVCLIILSAFFGACIGSFNLLHPLDKDAVLTFKDVWMQTVASAIKMPLLFTLTLLITLPSLYVFNAINGSRLSLMSVLRLLIASLGVLIAVLASLGPIIIFFSLCTTSYSFMQLLNVAVCTVSGSLGLAFLLRTLNRLILPQPQESPAMSAPKVPEITIPATLPDGTIPLRSLTGPLERTAPTDRKAKSIFRVWTIVFALVGAQMSWVLRPFIGSPHLPFEWLRHREGNFFMAVIQAIQNMFS
ncbi:MAG: hypothetical protein ABFD91_19270 [Anaerohalosphaeraceae bacterium]